MVQVCEIIEDIRIIKDTPEIETMKIAATIADEAFQHILSTTWATAGSVAGCHSSPWRSPPRRAMPCWLSCIRLPWRP